MVAMLFILKFLTESIMTTYQRCVFVTIVNKKTLIIHSSKDEHIKTSGHKDIVKNNFRDNKKQNEI
jgi:hypothetical protein